MNDGSQRAAGSMSSLAANENVFDRPCCDGETPDSSDVPVDNAIPAVR